MLYERSVLSGDARKIDRRFDSAGLTYTMFDDLRKDDWLPLERQLCESLSPEELRLRYYCAPDRICSSLRALQKPGGFGLFFMDQSSNRHSVPVVTASCLTSSMRGSEIEKYLETAKAAEFGVIVAPEFRRRKLAVRAVTTAAEMAFLRGFQEIIGVVDPANSPMKDFGRSLSSITSQIRCGHDTRIGEYIIHIPLQERVICALQESFS